MLDIEHALGGDSIGVKRDIERSVSRPARAGRGRPDAAATASRLFPLIPFPPHPHSGNLHVCHLSRYRVYADPLDIVCRVRRETWRKQPWNQRVSQP